MGKRLEFDDAARASLLRGVDQLAGAVRVTLGPRGRHVVLEHGSHVPTITDDGQTVAREIELADPFENLGARMVREAAEATGESAGDGTTTATVLAHALIRRGLQAIAAGHHPQALRRGMERAAAAAGDELAARARRIDDPGALRRVATVSAGGDARVGEMVAEAFARVGIGGVVQVEEGQAMESSLEVVEGVHIAAGWLSPYFVTAADHMEAVLEHPLVLVAACACTSAHDLVPALEAAARARRPLLVVAEDVDGEALSLLVVNRLRGTALSVAIRAPGDGEERRALLEDVAVLTGATLFAVDRGRMPEHATEDDLGRAREVVVQSGSTTLVEGGGRSDAVRAHVEACERGLAAADRDRDRDALRARIARLRGGIAVVHVGGATATAITEQREHVEDAVAATRAALEEGVVVGGGVAMLRAAAAIHALPPAGSASEQRGRDLVAESLEEPLRQIVTNAGGDAASVVERLRDLPASHGFDARTGAIADLEAAGILDPAKVTRAALRHAVAVSVLVLTTDAIVVDDPESAPPEKAEQ